MNLKVYSKHFGFQGWPETFSVIGEWRARQRKENPNFAIISIQPAFGHGFLVLCTCDEEALA